MNPHQNQEQGEALIRDVCVERMEHPDKPWQVELRLGEDGCLNLVATLQLAMRHPEYKDSKSAVGCAKLIAQLIALIPEERPRLRRLVEWGNNPKADY